MDAPIFLIIFSGKESRLVDINLLKKPAPPSFLPQTEEHFPKGSVVVKPRLF